MKMRYFYKVDQKREPIPASNVRRKSKPSGKDWREIHDLCCDPIDIVCVCGPRFFVKVDTNNKPIDFSLINRFDKITPEHGLKYAEINTSKNECCVDNDLSMTISIGVTGAFATVKVNGHIVNFITTVSSHKYKFREGDDIVITANPGDGVSSAIDINSPQDSAVNQTVFHAAPTPSVLHFVARAGAYYNISVGVIN